MPNLDFQMQMNFTGESENVFRRQLENGKFTILVETQVPEDTVDPKSAAEKLLELEETVVNSGNDVNAALAILDPSQGRSLRAVEFAAKLPEERRNRHVIYLSGADTTEAEFDDLLNFANANHLRNLIPVIGDAEFGSTVRECRKRHFYDSIPATEKIVKKHPENFAGAVVNPYQYGFYSLFGEYFSLLKKFGQGAQFAVTQAGWDMLKLQSLHWFLNTRECYYPVLTRLFLLSPGTVEEIVSGKRPGIRISPGFARILERELRYSRSQFESAQFRRIELQAAGCRLLGARGIQIAGIDSPAKAHFIIGRIEAALKEFTSFDVWLEEYNAYMASAEITPSANDFYLFDRSLKRDYPLDAPPVCNEEKIEKISRWDQVKYTLRKSLFANADRKPAQQFRLLKLLLTGCPGCDQCVLPQTNFTCPYRCPKHLANGPCGNVRPDGRCEISDAECIHVKILRAAYQRHDFSALEKVLPPPDPENI
ncbi:MAG: methylenetetrahydrofolate reductase C-terminal domain-containing protein [Victivallaceae bacterium]|nr:methylenetetrahydrofolate reductase C-terminal domain-containing protein [Victivallaceae bacterium]